MNNAPFQIVRLDPAHDRAAFNCDSDPLNRYLREQVTQDVRRHVTFCFIALVDGNRIAGYYTLASASFLVNGLPASISKKLPCDPTVPAVRMGAWPSITHSKGKARVVPCLPMRSPSLLIRILLPMP